MAVSEPPPDEDSNLVQDQEFWKKRCDETFRNFSDLHGGDSPGCNATWDEVSCWPPTPGGATAVLPCPASLRGVLYDSTRELFLKHPALGLPWPTLAESIWSIGDGRADQLKSRLLQRSSCYNIDDENVTHLCQLGGIWAPKSDYTHCKPLIKEDEELQVLWELREASTVYYIGYGMSLVALIVALWIFLYFKDLHCVRNTIHVNLLVTFALIDLTWIVTATLQSNPFGESYKVSCVLVIFLTYLMGTNFFWMFVEGLYLYIMVVKTFSMERLKFYVYALLGWGTPGLFVTAWATVKAIYGNNSDDPLAKQGCPWQNRDNYDYIFICPIIAVLLINIYFLCEIMWVLITKLRAANTLESKQYRKAAKALLVLIPLLGVTYVVVLVSPSHRTARVVFAYLQAALLSTQGFYVAVLYCFLNGEVRHSLRQHLERWKTRRNLSQQHVHRNSLAYRYSLPGAAQERRRSSQSRDVTSCLLLNSSDGHTPTSGRPNPTSAVLLSTSCDTLMISGRQPAISEYQCATSGFLPVTAGGKITTFGVPPQTSSDQMVTFGILPVSSGGPLTTFGDRSGGKFSKNVGNGGPQYAPVPTSSLEESVLRNFETEQSLADTSSTTDSIL